MTIFAYGDHAVSDELAGVHGSVWSALAAPGTWWTAAERVELAAQVRRARSHRADPPWQRPKPEAIEAALPSAAREAVWTLALDAHKIDRVWAERMIAELGDAPYVELIAVSACVTAIDVFAEALGVPHEPLPAAQSGEPTRERPEDVADDGAFVPMTVPWVGPNVARALSLVPAANHTFRQLVFAMYSGTHFADLVWEDTALSRPQVELVAARVSAVSECFY
jgi:hypothetical protein